MCNINEIKYMSKKQVNICNIAQELANKSDMKKSKHGAVIVYGKKIIGMGYNRYCHNKKCYTIHAEIDAIINAIEQYGKEILYNSELYVIRIGTNNIIEYSEHDLSRHDLSRHDLSRHDLRMSKPCENCTNFIIKNNIKTVYYSID